MDALITPGTYLCLANAGLPDADWATVIVAAGGTGAFIQIASTSGMHYYIRHNNGEGWDSWRKFGQMNWTKLGDYTGDNIPTLTTLDAQEFYITISDGWNGYDIHILKNPEIVIRNTMYGASDGYYLKWTYNQWDSSKNFRIESLYSGEEKKNAADVHVFYR